jgi:hypothetical protein
LLNVNVNNNSNNKEGMVYKSQSFPNTLTVSEAQASFLFTEYLTFNIPLVQPTVYLTGKVILKRDSTSGLITSYQEQWDKNVQGVLTSAILFGSGSVGGEQ